MSMFAPSREDELSEFRMNRRVYESHHRERLERDHWDEVALMHKGELIAVFDNIGEANSIGCDSYGEGRFSLIRIGLRIDFGSLNPRAA